ncbi:MAG: hypothetical protein JSW06_01360 [Thermoplasmatales archaeon]|nr:MAG: hypothetical protein JSW06_01360 [Thermoplasmatales archaeon]
MNKKLIIGSIGAVVILVLMSFTGVVGYQTTSSTIAKASPLFKVRTNRAIGEESKILNAKYVGKGNTLPFPKRDDKAIMVQNVIDSIRNMDDEILEKLIAYIINYARKDNRFDGINPDRIREVLYLIRNNDESLPMFNADTKNKPHTLCGDLTCNLDCATFGYGLYGVIWCISLPFIRVIWLISLPFFFIISFIIRSILINFFPF